MAIRGVLFDYGNVLCAPQTEDDVVLMATRSNLPLDQFKTLYWQFRDEYDLGEIDGAKYWSKIGERGGVEFSDSDIKDLIRLDSESWSRPNEIMAGWVEHLKAAGLVVGIISNMPIELRVHIMNESWLPKFHHYTFSCDVRSVKPAAEIYEHCLNGLGLKSEEAIFLDDRPMNVDAGLQLGISGHVFTSAQDLAPYVIARGLPPIATSPTI